MIWSDERDPGREVEDGRGRGEGLRRPCELRALLNEAPWLRVCRREAGERLDLGGECTAGGQKNKEELELVFHTAIITFLCYTVRVKANNLKIAAVLLAWTLAASCAHGAAEPKLRYVPQPGLRISGFWADKLDKLEQAWIPHCWKRLGVRGGAFQRNLAEATMLALERHPERKDLADILDRFVADDISRQQPDG